MLFRGILSEKDINRKVYAAAAAASEKVLKGGERSEHECEETNTPKRETFATKKEHCVILLPQDTLLFCSLRNRIVAFSYRQQLLTLTE